MEAERSTICRCHKATVISAPALAGAERKSDRQIGVNIVVAALLALCPAYSQVTTLNLGTQSRNADFSNLSFTRPVTVGTSLPATCQVGQLFFNRAATPGSNLYGCTAANTWTLQANGTSTGTGTGGTTTTGSGSALFTPSSLTFTAQTDGTTTPSQAIVMANTGTGPIAISGINLSGANSLDFYTSNNCGTTLASGMSCTIAVSLTPTIVGTETATLSVTDDTTTSPHTLTVSGSGTAVPSSSGASITPANPSASAGTPLTLTASKSVTWLSHPGALAASVAAVPACLHTSLQHSGSEQQGRLHGRAERFGIQYPH